jgi:phosphohistidine phosphatase SixA
MAAGGLNMGKPFTREALLRGVATRQARADAFARSMADTIAALEREGITSANAMAKALNERGVATLRSVLWSARTVIDLRRRLKRLGL